VRFLADTLDSYPDDRVKLQALNALTWVGEAALPVADVIERATASQDEYVRVAARYLDSVLRGTYLPTNPLAGS
jgi:HEAT repeat protein